MRTVSLFSGCLGLDLGLEQVGVEPVAYVENDPACQRVIAARRPGVPIISDVRDVDETLRDVELVAGGFPCQDLSYAGKGAGLAGERSGLWFEMARAVRVLRPRLVLVENVPGLATRGFGRVVYDLAEAGYVGQWLRLRAADVGAPHLRERLFILAHDAADSERGTQRWARHGQDARAAGAGEGEGPERQRVRADARNGCEAAADAERAGREGCAIDGGRVLRHVEPAAVDRAADADADGAGRSEQRRPVANGAEHASAERGREAAADAGGDGRVRFTPGYGADGGVGVERGRDVDGRALAGAGPDGGHARQSAADAEGCRRRAHESPRDGGDRTVGGADAGAGDRVGERHAAEGVQELGRSAGLAWGPYAPAIRRWESIIGRAAPAPTDDRGRLEPRFVEWMLGYPYGWVDVDDVSRSAQLRMLGNSVQVQVGTLAGELLLS